MITFVEYNIGKFEKKSKRNVSWKGYKSVGHGKWENNSPTYDRIAIKYFFFQFW